jgi:uncharacterized membrane protein
MDGRHDETSTLWLLLPRPIRRLPADLVAVAALVVLATLAATLPVVSETPLRVVLGLPLVLFAPGYALVAALFPEDGSSPSEGDGVDTLVAEMTRDGIDTVERGVLSFGLSIAVVPLLGIALSFTPWGLRFGPVVACVSGFTLVATAVAVKRRLEVPASERLHVPLRTWIRTGYDEFLSPETCIDGTLNVVLVCGVLLAVGSVGYAVAVPADGESFSELYLVTEDDTGDRVAGDYPQNLTVGESTDLVTGIRNHEN